SALLTTTMPGMRAVIEALKEAGLREKVKVMVGGAPVTQNFADEIGADLYAPDGPSAARKAKQMIAA
ncbi:cobalamin-binding protein, partial [candidate division KSB3 bacterium]|nr:cobalamin-binding protein [candidate division KSB3 bacterium]MBD3323662.1 cobalamin-binding protein [candidate division KSB3 bacterium]